MSEAVVRAERELCGYVAALQAVLLATSEDAMPQSLWDGGSDAEPDTSLTVASTSPSSTPRDMPDTLVQQVERETALERRRIRDLVSRQLAPQYAALRAALVQLGGGQDATGTVIDVPVAVLDAEIAAAAAESAELGRRMVELYDDATQLAAVIEEEVMRKQVPPL